MQYRIHIKVDTPDPAVPAGTISDWTSIPPEGVRVMGVPFGCTQVEYDSMLALSQDGPFLVNCGAAFDVEVGP